MAVSKKKSAARTGTKKAATKKSTVKKVAKKKPIPKGRVESPSKAGRKKLKKAATKKAAVKKEQVSRTAAQSEFDDKVKTLRKKHGDNISKITSVLDVSSGSIYRAFARLDMSPKDRIVGSDAQVAKGIIKAVKTGANMPTLMALTGFSAGKVRRLYEDATGEELPSTRGQGGAKKTRVKKSGAKKVKKGKGRVKAKTAIKGEKKVKGTPEGRKVVRKIWNLDTDPKEVAKLLKGKTITVQHEMNGHRLKPKKVAVMKVVKIAPSKNGGKVVKFVDDDQKTRIINLRDISAVS